MIQRPPSSTCTYTLFPYTTLCRSPRWTGLPAMALGAETGTATINVSENLASSSLLDVEARSVEALRETGYTGTEEIVVRTLDEVVEPDWRRPLALKIDTQGFELEVLKGAQQTQIGRAHV